MRIVVGCPVKDRDWIFDLWFDYVYAAVPDEWDLDFVFIIPEGDPCNEIAQERMTDGSLVVTTKEKRSHYVRNWSAPRYVEMVHLRNLLLNNVRTVHPDIFLSLDSDILLHRDALRLGYETLVEHNWDCVSIPTFLTPNGGERFTNSAALRKRGYMLDRDKIGATNVTDVAMAAKIMRSSAYNCDYQAHHLGEDTGWSCNVKEAGLTIGWAGEVPISKHVMDKKFLDIVDKRCGY